MHPLEQLNLSYDIARKTFLNSRRQYMKVKEELKRESFHQLP